MGGRGSLLRPGDAGEPLAHAGIARHPGVDCLSNPYSIALRAMDVFACFARRVRSLADSQCACSARIYPTAQQFRIRGMAGEPLRRNGRLRRHARAATEQKGVCRLRSRGRGGVHAQQSNSGGNLYPRSSGGVYPAQRDAGGALLDGRRIESEFRPDRSARRRHFADGPVGTCSAVQTVERGGHAVPVTARGFSATVLHHTSRLPLPAFVGSAADDSERPRGRPIQLLLERET